MSDYLPDHVLEEIFFSLPAKLVLDCRCVCKSWHSVISSSYFISEYNRRSFNNKNNVGRFLISHYNWYKRKEIFTLYNSDDSIDEPRSKKLELPFDHGLSRYMIIGFCYGLVCLLEISKSEELPKSLVIWNPSVGYSFKTFPIHPPVAEIDQQYIRSEQYGPSIQFSQEKVLVTIFGFGYVPVTNDYKVVRIVYQLEDYCADSKRVVEIIDCFALSVGEWKNITESMPPYFIMRNSLHASVNGALHWIANYEGSDDDRLVSKLIVAVFDMYDEEFKEFNLPDGIIRDSIKLGDGETQMISVAAIKQSLALLHYCSHARDQPFFSCGIWVMNEYGATESWTKLYNVAINAGVGKIVGLWRNEELIVETLYRSLITFHLKFRTVKNLRPPIHGEPWCYYGEPWGYYGDAFMECLLIYKKINGVPTFSTTASEQVFETAPRPKITNKGKEIVEE